MENTDHKQFTNYIDFLNDKAFINWRITGDESLGEYWDDFITAHPELKDAFEEAIVRFRTIKMNDNSLEHAERMGLLYKIKDTTEKKKQRGRIRHILRYAAVACVLIAAVVVYNQMKDASLPIGEPTAEYIVGEELKNTEVSLITASGTQSFGNDIHLTVDEDGMATVKSDNDESVVKVSKDVINKLIVPFGKRSRIDLADGTKVWLNSGSTLEFPSNFSGRTREVRMTGEIYIEVAEDKSKPFYVHAHDMQVNVLGTRFNVSSYEGLTEQSVVLVQGSVNVKSANNQSLVLKPNDMAVFADNVLNRKVVDVSNYISWKDGYLTFDHAPISDVLKKIERYYNLSFNMGSNINLQKRTCTGKIYLSENVDDVMATISILSGTSYRREGQKIYININDEAK